MFQTTDVLNETTNLGLSPNFSKSDPTTKSFNPSLTSSSPSSSSSSSIKSQKFENDISLYDSFGVDSTNGFLPKEVPLSRLEGDEIPEIVKKWEILLDQAQSIPLMLAGGSSEFEEEKKKKGREWRKEIREMETFFMGPDSKLVTDVRFTRRAHLVISFLSHFYIHSQPPPEKSNSNNENTSKDSNSNSNQSIIKTWNPISRFFFKNHSSISNNSSTSLDEDEISEKRGEFTRILPSSLSIPWKNLSKVLGIPPILTYSTTVLWNWTLVDFNQPITSSNIKMVTGFTNSKSEEWFYKTSLLMEIKGKEALGLIKDSLVVCFEISSSSSKEKEEKIQMLDSNLKELKKIIQELTLILHEVRKDCEPIEFYWSLRPWFRGADSGIPEKGWIFKGFKKHHPNSSSDDDNDEEEEEKDWISEFTGPSAGQSSLIHTLDLFLDVDHTERKPRNNKIKEMNHQGERKGEDLTFMERMLFYMPKEHRNFLNFLKNLSLSNHDDDDALNKDLNSNSTSTSTSNDSTDLNPSTSNKFLIHPMRSLSISSPILKSSYNEALISLKQLRDEHMRIATLYIITQSRSKPPPKFSNLPINFTGNLAEKLSTSNADDDSKKSKVDLNGSQIDEAETRSKVKSSRKRRYSKPGDGIAADALNSGAKGTGGTELTSFLRDCRNHTLDAVISDESLN